MIILDLLVLKMLSCMHGARTELNFFYAGVFLLNAGLQLISHENNFKKTSLRKDTNFSRIIVVLHCQLSALSDYDKLHCLKSF